MKIIHKTTKKEYEINGFVNYMEDETLYFAVSYVNEEGETFTERFIEDENVDFDLIKQ